MAASLLGGSPQSNSRRLPLFKPFKAPCSFCVLATFVWFFLPRVIALFEREALDVPVIPPVPRAVMVEAQPFTDAAILSAPFANPR